jgi:CRISPR/Cas system CSM-associated protein Csm3 (group 7 of RAMP superfamily)
VPYIPGSSLHGVVRAWVEKALRSAQTPLSRADLKEKLDALDEPFKAEVKTHAKQEVADFLGLQPAQVDDDTLFAHWKVYNDPPVCDPLSDVDQYERIPEREQSARAWKRAWMRALGRDRQPCAVSRLFGYTGQRGRVKFTHAWPTVEAVPIDVITRVAINRLTGAADEGKLFDLEAIPPGVTFHFFVVLENLSAEEKGHFAMGLRALNLQLAGIGAHGTVGFGMVDIDPRFTATLQAGLFEKDVEADFIAPQLAQRRKVPGVDLDKWPRFFQALVLAAQAGSGEFCDKQLTVTPS